MIKWWIMDCYPSNDNGRQPNDVHGFLWWCLHKMRWWTQSKKLWPPTIATPQWWSMKPWIGRKKLCAPTTTTPRWWSILFTQNETMNKRKNNYGNLLQSCDYHTMMMINSTYTKWNHEQKGKKWWALTIAQLLHHDNDPLCSMLTPNENMKGVNKVK